MLQQIQSQPRTWGIQSSRFGIGFRGLGGLGFRGLEEPILIYGSETLLLMIYILHYRKDPKL